MSKICAVIVTYNRPELLCRCIDNLMKQDYLLDILVYDNHSTADTKSLLEEKGLLEGIIYYYAESNTGGSGGFHNGMKMAVEKGYDALWLMDDDGYPVNKETLSRIVYLWENKLNYQNCLLNSLVVSNIDTLNLTFSLDREYDGHKIIERAQNGLVKEFVSPFNGTFVPVNMVKEIGYPIKDFFVYGDETEYTLRVKYFGYELYTVVDSIYFHPSLVCKKKKLFGFEIAVSNVPLWKNYCSARNTMYYYKKYFNAKIIIKKIIRFYLGCLFAENKRMARFIETTKGIIDGLKGDLTKKLDLSK